MSIQTVRVVTVGTFPSSAVNQASLVLTDADIKAMTGDGSLRVIVPATEFTDGNQVPAAVPIVDSVQLFMHFAGSSQDYRDDGDVTFTVILGSNDSTEIVQVALNTNDGRTIQFENAVDQLMNRIPLQVGLQLMPTLVDSGTLRDNALLVQLTNGNVAFTEGGDGNYLKVTITYHLIDTGLTPAPPP